MEERDEYDRKQQAKKTAELLKQNAAHVNAMSYDHTTSGPIATHKYSRARARDPPLSLSNTLSLARAVTHSISPSRARSLSIHSASRAPFV